MKSTYTDDKEAVAIVQAAFPDYRHSPSKLRLEPFHPVRPSSYWNGGTKDYWAFVRLSDRVTSAALPESGSGFTPDAKEIKALPEGFALVRYTSGNYTSACIYLNAVNITPLLPLSIELTYDEEVVLSCTSGLKSAARREQAAQEWGSYTVRQSHIDRWNAAVTALQQKGLVAKNGSVTTAGRNRATQYFSLRNLRPASTEKRQTT